ncbi:hypothetical protein JHK87_055862 [Glycine soja]|nr:hypothetical protein JHK87_055862 [Glycine soja]
MISVISRKKHKRSTVGLLGKVFSFRKVSTPHGEPNKVAETVGARRIVSEWPDLDFEARRFTARILGDDQESESIQPPNQSKDLNS